MSRDIVSDSASEIRSDRTGAAGGPGMTVWLTGLSGSGKSTIARGAMSEFIARGRAAYVLDGDELRQGLNADLGFSDEDRSENVRRVSSVALLMADAGLIVLVPVIAPFASDREQARTEHERKGLLFCEVFVDAPVEVCERRDPKGLYARARNGELMNFTGLGSRYEAPATPWLRLDSAHETPDVLIKVLVGAVLAARNR